MRSSKAVFVRNCARVLVLGLGAMPLACLAATINVTTTGDAGAAGSCTVRQAIATINNGAGPDANTGNCSIASGTLGTNDKILFDLATFPNGGGNTITLADASTSTLSIYAANLIIDATANGQVAIQRPAGAVNKFGIMVDSTAGSLTLNHLTLSNGAGGVCPGPYGGGGGIGICGSALNLTLNNCTLSGNSADSRGGGIYSDSGSVTLNNSTLSSNSADGDDGGGIFSLSSAVSLSNSTLSGNSALNGGGGGVEVLSGGSLTLINSTLSSNQAKFGGGIMSNNGTVTLSNSTVSGNSSSSSISGAGGIEQTGAGDSVTATNSTISANTGGYYGGIFGSPGSISVINSIVAGNSGSYPYQIPPFFNNSGSITDGDPQLGALANNGGPTKTMLPLPGSPAVDAIACTNAPATDQRGVARPQGAQCDIGAVETAGPFALTVDELADNLTVDSKCSLREAIAIFTQGRSTLDPDCPPSASASNKILFAAALSNGSIVLASPLALDNNVAVTIDGSGAPGLAISGGSVTSIFNVASSSAVTMQDLRMVNGSNAGGGGAISSTGTLTINHSTLSNNLSTGSGGAIDVEGSGVLTMADSTVTNNQAAAGGGMFIATGGTLNLSGSNISTNHASTSGGGVAGNGHFTIGNSTFSGNTAVADGGAIYNNKASNTNKLINSTIAGNTAVNGGNLANAAGTLNLQNTIVANSAAGNNCHGTITLVSGVLTWPLADVTCGASTHGDPKLGALHDNGGPSFTMLPGVGSAAVDAGNTITCNAAPINHVDQRGIPRPQGAQCDIGAAEVAVPQTLTVTVSGSGTVSANPAPTPLSGGILNCASGGGPNCSANYPQHVLVTLTATPATGYGFTGWGGNCAIDGTVTMDANKSCTATFAANLHSIKGTITGLTAGGLALHLNNGNQNSNPASGATVFTFPSQVSYGSSYTVSVAAQPTGLTCTIASPSGTMPDNDVTVAVGCVASASVLSLSVDDGHLYARYGHIADYTVTLSYSGSIAATNVPVSNTATAGLDLPNALWCLGPACTPSTQGALNTNANLPANGSVTWLISVPVLANTPGPTVTLSASAGGIGASDTDTLVVYRDSFDVANGGGVASLTPNGSANEVFTLPASNGNAVADVYQSHGGNVRLLAREGAQERASAWARTQAGATLALDSAVGASDQRIVLLEGAEQSIVLPIAD